MKRQSILEPHADQLCQWLGKEHMTYKEAAERLSKQNCSVSPQTVGEWWNERQLQDDWKKDVLGRIKHGAEMWREIEEEYRKNPVPGLDTLMKWLRSLMMDIVLKDKDDRDALKLVASLLRPVLEHTRLDIQKEALALHRAKFQRQTCELFLEWYADQRVREIAESPDDTDAKTEILGRLMFGEVWDD